MHLYVVFLDLVLGHQVGLDRLALVALQLEHLAELVIRYDAAVCSELLAEDRESVLRLGRRQPLHRSDALTAAPFLDATEVEEIGDQVRKEFIIDMRENKNKERK